MGIPVQSIELYYTEGGSDKVYNVQLEAFGQGYRVHFQYGRRGSYLNEGDKITDATYEKALKVYTRLVGEKTGKGYTDDPSGQPGTFSGNLAGVARIKDPVAIKQPAGSKSAGSKKPVKAGDPNPVRRFKWDEDDVKPVIPQLMNPIEEDEVPKYLQDDAWGSQEKHNGKHLVLTVLSNTVSASNKKGKACGFPVALEAPLLALGVDLVIDGESIGNKLYAYDLLEYDGKDLRSQTYIDRYNLLNSLKFKSAIEVSELAIGFIAKSGMLCDLKAKKKEGIVFKKLAATFTSGRPNSGGDMLKSKFYATASVIVAKGREGKRSIGMELIGNDGREFVGNCTIPQNKAVPAIGTVVEIRYLYAYKGGSLYQPNYEGPRDDVDVEDCLLTQLKYYIPEGDD